MSSGPPRPSGAGCTAVPLWYRVAISIAARELAREYFERFPKDRYETQVETWREIQSYNIEFVMKRLREPRS
jgi:hypothetical protein